MSWKTGVVTVIVLTGAAYTLGYWPEHQARTDLETRLAAVRQEADTAEARVRAARLLGQLLNMVDAVEALNYGQAQTYSSRFFDDVQTALPQTVSPEVRSVLGQVLQRRDSVTAALARGDQNASTTLRSLELQLRKALGYDVPPAAETAPQTAPEPGTAGAGPQ